ncbi:MAG: CinA family protein [Candidatus Omnitrophica bacterium]|nr:CinA family protein [Candidatus Omnitrophota bacterium]
MEKIIKEINRLLIKKKKTLAVAESCTGGKLSSLLTEIKGSSCYFLGGIVAYSNRAKETLLRVPKATLLKNGPVSPETTQLLASSVKKLLGADIGIGITGIAGPTGETKETPRGTVFIALETKKRRFCQTFLFKGRRTTVRKKAALFALEILKKTLK